MQEKGRSIIFLGLLIVFVAFYILRLVNLQLAEGEAFLEQSHNRILRKTAIVAPRGEICDRLGRPLVTNRKGYAIYIEKDMIGEEGLNTILLKLSKVFLETGENLSLSFPVSNKPYTYINTLNDDSDDDNLKKNFIKFLKAKKLSESIDAASLVESLKTLYGITNTDNGEIKTILAIRYEMDIKTKNSSDAFMLASDANIQTISKIRERYAEFPGVSVEVVPVREYVEDGVASNILGRVGSIFAEEYSDLKEKGYRLDDIVGKDGIEKTLESYLKGKDGIRQVEKNTEGQITAIIDSINPEPGNNVILTIDKDLQKVAEESLKNRINEIKATYAVGQKEGYDAKGGAAVAIDVNTGEILALATYPTYKLSEFSKNFSSMMNDPLKPLLNRPISGTYPPGSTFKVLTGIAGLEEKAITTSWTFTCSGKYTFFDSYQPSCYHGNAHGTQNIEGAIRFSCNAFFFDTARLLGIEKLNQYMFLFGFGKQTGIELPGEVKGIVAGKEERQAQGKIWNPGDTIQTGIGQSDNMFTPLQIASYAATVASNGSRYKPHIVKSVKDYHYMNTIMQNDPIVTDKVPMSEATQKAIKTGMRRALLEGSAASRFAGINVEVACKTGTAQVPGGSDNGVFIAFAPYDKPQIAVSVVVEHGGEGGYVSIIARDIIEKYFATKELNDVILPENSLIS